MRTKSAPHTICHLMLCILWRCNPSGHHCQQQPVSWMQPQHKRKCPQLQLHWTAQQKCKKPLKAIKPTSVSTNGRCFYSTFLCFGHFLYCCAYSQVILYKIRKKYPPMAQDTLKEMMYASTQLPVHGHHSPDCKSHMSRFTAPTCTVAEATTLECQLVHV